MKKELLLGLGLAAGVAGFAQEGVATETKMVEKEDEAKKEIVMQQDSTRKEVADTISRYDVTGGEGIGIEPDPVDGGEGSGIKLDSVGGDSEELEPTDEGADTGMEKESPTKFTISTGLGYSIGGKTYMCNRIAGSGKLFEGTKGELIGYAHIDYDNPMYSTGSGKVTLQKSIYKGISLDGDYTFTGTGGNVVRFGFGYGGKIGEGQYAIKIFPMNTNGSPISAKVSFGTRVGKNGQLSSFVFVDLGNNSYYGETEYAHRIAEGVAGFFRLGYGGLLDFQMSGSDSQTVKIGAKIDIK